MKFRLIAPLTLCLLPLSSCGMTSPQPDADEASLSHAQAAFSRLQTLVGTWERPENRGGSFQIVFSLTAAGTVVVETWLHDGKVHSLTLYHLDGEGILATHYCPQGNQPRLRWIEGTKESVISFSFQDATNLDQATQSWQSFLSYEIDASGQSLTHRDAYSNREGSEESSMTLIRVADAALRTQGHIQNL